MPYAVTIRGRQHEWQIPCPDASVEALREDGFEVVEVVNTIPEWVVSLGLTRSWCALQDLWELPSRLMKLH